MAAAPGSGGSGSVAVDELRADPVGMLDLLARTADGMVAISPTGTILRWNDGAAELLGYEEREVVGRPCHEILGFLDRCGNAVCSAFCSGRRPTESEELTASRDVLARSKTGNVVWLSVSTLLPPPAVRRFCRIVHFFREIGLPPELERLIADRLQARSGRPEANPLVVLTPREREVLQLLADGADTREIARTLVVSLATVRNHVQNILAKLHVHSRLEAVVLFVRFGR